jgi:hypothetical protein
VKIERGIVKEEAFDLKDEQPDPGAARARPIKEILREIVSHAREIVQSEMRLVMLGAKDEISARKTAMIALATALMLTAYGGVFLLLGFVYALSTVWPAWLAALVVGALAAIVGLVVMKISARKSVRPDLT